MTGLNLADDTFVCASPARLAAVVADPARWAAWWPDLTVETTRDRGLEGRQWRVASGGRGTAEIWLEPWHDGTLVHCYLRLDPGPPAGRGEARRAHRHRERRARAWKSAVHALKDELERNRTPGTPAPP